MLAKIKKVITSSSFGIYAGVFLFGVLGNTVIFREVIFSYLNILQGDSVFVVEELVPFFDFKRQFLEGLFQPLNYLTGLYDFRIKYSWLTSWVRYYAFLPIALVALNALSFTIIFYANKKFNELFLDRKFIFFQFLGSFSAAILFYLILLYAKVTHFYTLIFGYALFVLALSLLLRLIFQIPTRGEKSLLPLALCVVCLAIFNPAIHFIVLILFTIILMCVWLILQTGYKKIRSKGIERGFDGVICLVGIALCIGLLYMTYYSFFIRDVNGAVEDTAILTKQLITNSSVKPLSIVTLQSASVVDENSFGSYLTPPKNRIWNISYFIVAFLGSIFFLRRSVRPSQGYNLLGLSLMLAFVAIFFALGYSNQSFSAQNTARFFVERLSNSYNPIASFILDATTLFFNILRYPHRFLFLLHAIMGLWLSVSLSFLYVEIFNVFNKALSYLKPKSSSFGFSSRIYNYIRCILFAIIVVCLTLTPFFIGKNILYTFSSGSLAGFTDVYKIPDDLTNIRNYLQNHKEGKLVIMPSSEIYYRKTSGADQALVKMIDKFFIYYLGYPTVYYGSAADKIAKSEFALIYLLADSNTSDWLSLLQNRNITYILVNHKQITREGSHSRDYLEKDIEKQLIGLEERGLLENVYRGDFFSLEKIVNNKESLSLYTTGNWFAFQNILDTTLPNTFAMNDINKGVCDEKSFVLVGDKYEMYRNLISLCHKNELSYKTSVLPFMSGVETVADYMNSFYSLLGASTPAGSRSYNRLGSAYPAAYESLRKEYVSLRKNLDSVTYNFSIAEAGLYNLEFRGVTSYPDLLFTITNLDTGEKKYLTKHYEKSPNLVHTDFGYEAFGFDYYSMVESIKFTPGKYILSFNKIGESLSENNVFIIDNVLLFSAKDIMRIEEEYKINQVSVDGYNLIQFDKK